MPTNTLAPQGLLIANNYYGAAPTYQSTVFRIKSGYASAIGMNDAVKTLTGGDLGYVGLATTADTSFLGVFGGILEGFYSSAIQGLSYGLNGSWVASTTSSDDILCTVITDPGAVFKAQVVGGPWEESWRGKNINFTSGTNGAPNFTGRSTLSLDGASINTTPTLPFRIMGPAGVAGGLQDPANTNPWIFVKLNTAEMVNPTGI